MSARLEAAQAALAEQQAKLQSILDTLTRAQVGVLFQLYLDGAADTGWEGYHAADLEGITKFLGDMVIAADHLEL